MWTPNEIELRFWGAVAVGIAIKTVLTEETQTRKKALAGIICGAAAAFYGTDLVMSYFSIATETRELVVIGLVITGEHITRGIVEKTPEIVAALIDALKGRF
ncbi:hypothetical protein Z949_1833 [Sulfitobacter guttiformis KCTC 32187]|uniref:Uncharacterized protein n=2 Tax=Sulfitobacter guttiformis TaxID=74349 RepID=A0A420DHB4_9RHOB|nr:hypothetical protein Z949_1833 [Sulfitobacter guttiformis KCTC 32187]RKE93615.1 hypothetical protein C8N30_2692 [Sulfitobacter guttiformis]